MMHAHSPERVVDERGPVLGRKRVGVVGEELGEGGPVLGRVVDAVVAQLGRVQLGPGGAGV